MRFFRGKKYRHYTREDKNQKQPKTTTATTTSIIDAIFPVASQV